MLTIATICARGGSTGLPGKNIRPLMGKPLIAHTIEQALATPGIDRVFVSTDSQDIADAAMAAGAEVPFLRPADLASNTAPKLEALEHLVMWIESNIDSVKMIVDLDPTSPLREISDIQACMDMFDASTDVVITGFEADKNPYFNMVEIKDDGNIGLSKPPSNGIFGRQQAPKVYSMNASIYVWRRESITKGLWDGNCKLFIMPRERSIDIDHKIDFDFVEFLMKQQG